MIADLRQRGHGLNQAGRKILWMGCHKADPLNAIHRIYTAQQLRKIYPIIRIRIGVHVLPKQRDLTEALFCKGANLCNDIFGGARPFSSAHIWHDAIGTEIIAAIGDRNKSRKAAAAHNGKPFRNFTIAFPDGKHTFP